MEYLEEVDKMPAKRSNAKLYEDVLEKFLDSKLKIAKVSPEIFNSRDTIFISDRLWRYVKNHHYPIKVHCRSGVVYLERI